LGYCRAVAAARDPYDLLGVPHDASDERIKAAYELEINRAIRDGAIRYAAELSAAYDTISTARRRALYDRHGFTAINERSSAPSTQPRDWRPPPSTPARSEPTQPRRGVKVAVLFVFAVGIAAWLIGATQHLRASQHPGITTPIVRTPMVVYVEHEHEVLCQATPHGQSYVYSEPVTNTPHCDNGAEPLIVGHK
jgi:hypothetical protein